MEALEPLINLLVVLTALSMIAERLTNLVKLDHAELRTPELLDVAAEKERERGILFRSLLIAVFVAVVAKADLFEMLVHLDSPWNTLGWVRLDGSEWERVPATANVGTAAYAVGGSILTGLGLSFGSKFWHELLDGLLEIRRIAQAVKQQKRLVDRAGQSDG